MAEQNKGNQGNMSEDERQRRAAGGTSTQSQGEKSAAGRIENPGQPGRQSGSSQPGGEVAKSDADQKEDDTSMGENKPGGDAPGSRGR